MLKNCRFLPVLFVLLFFIVSPQKVASKSTPAPAYGEDYLNVGLVGQADIPYAHNIVISGGYAYLTETNVPGGLHILDLADPVRPVEVGFLDTSGFDDGIAVAGNYAYISLVSSGMGTGYAHLSVVNISDPANPVEAGFLSLSRDGAGLDVAVSGNYAYIAQDQGGVTAVDISNPAHPYEVGFYDTPGNAQGLAASGSSVYVADALAGLRILNFANPALPAEAGFYDTPGKAYDITLVGSNAFVADGESGLRIIDVSKPATPVEVGYFDTPDDAMSVDVVGNRAYVADYDGGLRVLDLTNLAAPVEIGFYETYRVLDAAHYGSYIYAPSTASGLLILEYLPADLLLYEPFSSDVFGAGGWTRNDPSVSVDTTHGWLHFAINGVYDNYAEKMLPASLPITVETRMRLVSGGNDYRLPSLHVLTSDPAKTIVLAYGADPSMGWVFNEWGAYSGVHTKAPPSENVWMTVKATYRADGGELWAKYDSEPDFTFVTNSTWSIPDQITKIRLYQPWDSINDVDYIRITGGRETLPNLALQTNGGMATASSYGCYGGYCATPDQANDGVAYPAALQNSFWAASAWQMPAWLQIELDQTSIVSKVKIYPVVRGMTYDIKGSTDGTTWSSLVPAGTRAGDQPAVFTFPPTAVRYVRMNVAASDAPGTYAWATETSELEVYGSPIILDSPATLIDSEGWFNCMKTEQNGARCWGWNRWGQLGNQTMITSTVPVPVSGLAGNPLSITAGWGHACALSGSGGVQCWGWNGNGQLGVGTYQDQLVPVDVIGLTSGVAAVDAGGYHTCAATSTGGVLCWGGNWDGMLGDGTTEERKIPVGVQGLSSGIKAIRAGGWHTCALTTSGGVKCWGRNVEGQLGNDTTTTSLIPVNVTGLASGVQSISAGWGHSCAVTGNGGAKCWGNNSSGQLGNGTSGNIWSTPMDVIGLQGEVVAVAAGAAHTCALTSTGGVKCWGGNWYGQLGDGTGVSSSIPVDVQGLTSGVQAITAGESHACALLANHEVKCWGGNQQGQLGNGSYTNSSIPVSVAGWDTRFIDLTVSVYKSIPEAERTPYDNILQNFADAIYEMSNGTHKVRTVTVYQNGEHAGDANVLWNASEWPRAHVTGYGKPGLRVWMGDTFPFDPVTPYNALNPANWKAAGYVLGHEWGHYYYGIYDEYALREGDIPVPNSVMNNNWLAAFGNYNYLNFSVSKNTLNGQGKTAQDRMFTASGWETLARPPWLDPRDGIRSARPERTNYPELAGVAPAAGDDSSLELPSTSTAITRSNLQIVWVPVTPQGAAPESPRGGPYTAWVSSISGSASVYPSPVILVAHVSGADPMAGVGISASVKHPLGSYFDLSLADDGLPPDVTAEDGLYSGYMWYNQDGSYEVTVEFDNNAGSAVFTQASAEHASGPGGEIYSLVTIPVGENFSAAATTNVSIAGYQSDDHGNSPATATSLTPNNTRLPGRIDQAGDVDYFRLIPAASGFLVIRVDNFGLGIQPHLRILGSDGVTLLSNTYFTPTAGTYYFTLLNVTLGESIYLSVADKNASAALGLYEVSAGVALPSEVLSSRRLNLPVIIR